MSEAVKVRVLFFGAARDVVENNPIEIVLATPATVSSAFQS